MIKTANKDSIQEAATCLRRGDLVAIPTETVYGLAANALDENAVKKIFALKNRPAINPLIIHVPSLEMADRFVVINDMARRLATAFWPGALTMILPRRENCAIAPSASAGLPTLAVRVPSHPVALELLRSTGLPLAAPSANPSGTISPTTPRHVIQGFGDRSPMTLAAGPCKIGLESTIIDLSTNAPEILRAGGITPEQISDVLGQNIPLYDSTSAQSTDDQQAPKSPGLLLKHYSPSIPVRLNAIDLEQGEALLAFGSDKFMGIKNGGGPASALPDHSRMNLSEEGDLDEAAANLFKMMRALDNPAHKGIAVMAIPNTGIGIAINDRLKRAAG